MNGPPERRSGPVRRAAPDSLAGKVVRDTIPDAGVTSGPHELSGWLRGRVAARVRDVLAAGLDPDAPDDVIVAPLGRTGTPGSREDRSCDRCRQYVPEGTAFYTFGLRAARSLLLIGGLCAACSAKETAS